MLKRLAIRLVVLMLVVLRFVVFGLLYAPLCWFIAKMMDLARYLMMLILTLVCGMIIIGVLAFGPWPLLMYFLGYSTKFPWTALALMFELVVVAAIGSLRPVSSHVHHDVTHDGQGIRKVTTTKVTRRRPSSLSGFYEAFLSTIHDLQDRGEVLEAQAGARTLWLQAIGKLPVLKEGAYGYHFTPQ